MASKEEQSLLGDLQSSSEVSAAISSLLEEDHSVMGHTGSGSQMGFVPVEVRHMKIFFFMVYKQYIPVGDASNAGF